MRIAVMQPYLFPYIGYFQLLKAVDKFVLLDDVAYINKGWINRNTILVNGKAVLFTVPLEKASQNKRIMDIRIFTEGNWKDKMLKTMEMAYKKAPYFERVFPLLAGIIREDIHHISPFIYHSLQVILAYLDIETQVISTSSKYAGNKTGYQDRIMHICLEENAGHYINPAGGTELYQRDAFERRHIQLSFLKPGFIPYKHHSAVFVPGLSIIDILMHNSRHQVDRLLSEYMLE